MKTRIFMISLIALSLMLPGLMIYAGAEDGRVSGTYSGSNVIDGYFTENLGQWNEEFVFIGETKGGHLALGQGSAYLNLPKYDEDQEKIFGGHVLAYRFMSSSDITPNGEDELPHLSNYFLGNDPDKWVSGARNYQRISYPNLWDNIDLSYYLTPGGPKYEFHLGPGSDLSDIRIRIDGIQEIETSKDEMNIIISDELTIKDVGLVAYFADDRSLIDASFKNHGDLTYGFELEEFDTDRAIVIDPYLKFTFLGGSFNDQGVTLTQDDIGNTYATTDTGSTDFPTTPGAYDTTHNGGVSGDIAITKINSTFLTLDYSTFIGGSGSDEPGGLDVRNGEVVFTGVTDSKDYPITANAYNDTNVGWRTLFVTKLNRSGGSLEFSTFVDGKENESGSSVRYDDDGNVLVIGASGSSDFPTTAGAYDRTLNSTTTHLFDTDVVILKLNSQGSDIIFSTFYGGNSGDNAVLGGIDENGNILISGMTYSTDLPMTSGAYDPSLSGTLDLFIAKLNHNGSKLERSTYFGSGGINYGSNAVFLPDGDIAAVGYTHGTITTTPGAYDTTANGDVDTYIARFDRNLTTLKAATYVGGSLAERNPSIAVDPMGDIFLYGTTMSNNFPTTTGADDTTFNGTNNQNLYLAKFDGNLSTLMYSTFLGGNGFDMRGGMFVLTDYKVMLSGYSTSTDFKVEGIGYDQTNNGFGDHFILELSLLSPPTPPIPLNYTRGDDWVHLTWELPYSDGGSPITGYEVWKGEYPGTEQLLISLSASTFDHNDTTIAVDDEWYYYVRAVNEIGPSLRTNRIRIADEIAPWLGIDLTPAEVASATEVTFSTEVFDNAYIDSVWVEYHLDLPGDTGYFNFTMTDQGDGTFSHTIPLPDEQFGIDYFFALNDTSDNWFTGPMGHIDVTGIIDPVFGEDNTETEIKAGDPLKFSIEVWDNVGIEDVTVEFWSERVYRQNVSMENTAGNTYEYTYKTKRYSLAPIHYRFHAVDPAEHWNSTPEMVLDLLDAEAPMIAADNTPLEATTGDPFTFSIQVSDNQEVETVWVEYIIDGETFNETLPNDYGNFYELEIIIPDVIGRMSYRFFALDMNDNLGWVPGKNVRIVDNDMPLIGEDLTNDTGMCGELSRFAVVASDNVEIGSVIVEYWFGEGAHYRGEMQDDGNYVMDIMIPESEGRDLVYFFEVTDTSGNSVDSEPVKITVKDRILPSLTADLTPGMAYTGGDVVLTVKASDNIGIKRISCIWNSGPGPDTELFLERSDGTFTGSIEVPIDSIDDIDYHLIIVDSSGNQFQTEERTVIVSDNLPPVIEQVQDLDIGPNTELNIAVAASDNIGVASLTVENSPLELQGNSIRGRIEEPGAYPVKVSAMDEAGNSAEMTFVITISADSGGSGEGGDGDPAWIYIPPVLGILVLAAAFLFFIFAGRERKDIKKPLSVIGDTAPTDPIVEQQGSDELDRLFNASYGNDK
ncbi:MAG: hypothetical protein ACMUHM_03260 [Thermoplasmatota archaeon]